MKKVMKNLKDKNDPEKPKEKSKFNRFVVVLILITIFAIFKIGFDKNVEILRDDFKNQEIVKSDDKNLDFDSKKCENRLKYWSVCLEDFGSYAPSLRSHNRVFQRLNFEFVNASNGDDWDILWAFDFPWRSKNHNNSLFAPLFNNPIKSHQKVHHFPGIAALISKSFMNKINRNYEFILPSFILPDQHKLLDEFVEKNPNKKLLEKNIKNRGVKIVKVSDVNPNNEEIFYQEFMDNPFLIDGHAFDFGVFVLITSFDPIRVYRYSDEILLRFCSEKYHPFDPKNRDKYVVRDGSIPPWEMPTFKELFEKFSFKSKTMFENHIKKLNFNVKKFWERIDNAIGKIIQNTEYNVLDFLEEYNQSSHNFYELVRFDIILDSELNPFVVEVNMSPNLTPAAEKYEKNSLIYEQLIYNVVKMIGGSSKHEFMSRFDSSDTIVKNQKNLATSITECVQNDCQNNCNKTICEICQPCMKSQTFYHLSEAFREHQNAASFKRVFPIENHFNDEKFVRRMSRNNRIQMKWFKGKCEEDERWC